MFVCVMQELQSSKLKVLIPTPNSRNKCGFNSDRFVLNPECTDQQQLKFLGVLLGVAIRTKRPLNLFLAPFVWKLLVGIEVTMEDLEEVE